MAHLIFWIGNVYGEQKLAGFKKTRSQTFGSFVRLSITPSCCCFYHWRIDWKSDCKWWIDWKSDLMDFCCMWFLNTSGPFSRLYLTMQRSNDRWIFRIKKPQPFVKQSSWRWCEWGIPWSLCTRWCIVVQKNNNLRNIEVPSKSRGSMFFFVLVALEGFWGSILTPPKRFDQIIHPYLCMCMLICYIFLYICITSHSRP